MRLSRRQVVQGAGVVGLGLVAGCGPLPGQARSPKVPTIGFLSPGTPENRAPLIARFREGLTEHGYTEGQNVVIEYRFSGADDTRLPALASELVQLPVDLILASGTASYAAKAATSTIPIVLGGNVDPVRVGLVASLARPGGNVTGMALLTSELMGKRLELLKDTLPALTRLAVLANMANPVTMPQLEALDRAAEAFQVRVRRLEVNRAEDFELALQAAVDARAEAFIVPSNALYTANRVQLVALAARHRLPAIYDFRDFTEAGGLMAYGPSIQEAYRQATRHVDKILKGAKPTDLPVEQSSRFEFTVNLQAAQALGITFPHTILLQVTEMIQ